MMEIEQYKGIPYKSHGRDNNGLDCWGLVFLVHKEQLGVELPAWSHLYRDAHCVNLKEIKTHTEPFKTWQEVEKPKIGDVALFEVGRGFHVGLCVDTKGCRVLHITEGCAVTIEDIRSANWKRRFRGFFEYVG